MTDTRRTIAIGDIHGCSIAFEALLDAVEPTRDDCLIGLGDYVDRGPNTRAVIDRLIRLGDQCHLTPLIGNHELMMLGSLQGSFEAETWLFYGGQQTVDSYGGDFANVPETHLQFLAACHPYWETETHLFLHANYEPGLDIHDQPESALFWTHLHRSTPPAHRSGKTVVVGHTPQEEGNLLDLGHLICVDTCCYGGGWLTALDVQRRNYWQANQLGELRTGVLDSPPGDC